MERSKGIQRTKQRLVGELPPGSLINMETSQMAFNERVLGLSADERVPLLERVRFVSIFGSNTDEFFMTRSAGFKRQLAVGSHKPTMDGLTPAEQLAAIDAVARRSFAEADRLIYGELLPKLAEQGIQLLRWAELTDGDRAYLVRQYAAHLETTLTPLPAGPGRALPHVRNLRPALVVELREDGGAESLFVIELPGELPRFLPLPGGLRFVPLEELVRNRLERLFPGRPVVRAHTFRVMRSANLQIDDAWEGDELVRRMEEEVARRPFRAVVRMEVQQAMPEPMRERLVEALRSQPQQERSPLGPEDVQPMHWLVDLAALRELAALPISALHYPPLSHTTPFPRGSSIFEALRRREVLVAFPEHSFEGTLERFLAEAADDPAVTAVKITLYRAGRGSRVVKLLRRARRKGKQVLAMVEIKASFDERRNIEFARSLEAAGIDVVFGPPELKVHAKTALVERRETDGLRRYLYIGTGNLNAATAAAYTDLGLLTTDPALGEELARVFAGLAGEPYEASAFEQLLVAPVQMRERFLQMIAREAEHARAGRGGHIRAKLNGLADLEVIHALYAASRAGVRVELVVRGLCSLRPGVPGLSENISIVSVLGRFLEHSRIYRFENAGEPEYFIGSADWRTRNLSRRVEVATPVRAARHRAALDRRLHEKLTAADAWELRPDGSYLRRAPAAPSAA